MKDPYSILGVSSDATDEEVKMPIAPLRENITPTTTVTITP